MGRLTASFAAVVFAVLLAPSGQAWYQLHGGPDRNAVWQMPDEPLDVLAQRRVLHEDESLTTLLGPNFSLTVDGLVTVVRNTTTDGCTLLRVPMGVSGVLVRVELDQCRAPWFQGYDPASDTVYVCSIQYQDGPVLQARSARDGALKWAIVPSRDLGILHIPNGEEPERLFWGCSGVAFDFARREAVVPFITAQTGLDAWHHRVAGVELNEGRINWVTQIPVTSDQTGGSLPVNDPVDGSGFYILPLSATMTSNGAVVTAIVICPEVVTCDVPPTDQSRQPAPFQTAAAWLNRDGEVQGMAFARRDHRTQAFPLDQVNNEQRTAGGAFWAAGHGNNAVASLGGFIIIIDPESTDWTQSAAISTREQPQWGVDSLPAPVWTENVILAPFYRRVTAFDPATLATKWSWETTQPGWLVQDLLAARNGDVYVLVGKSDRSSRVTYGIQGNESMVVRLDGVTGDERQRLPVNVENWMTTEPDMMLPVVDQGFSFPRPPVLVPIAGGVAISDLSGNLVEIGIADGRRRPMVEVDDRYPEPGAQLSLRVPGIGEIGTQRVLVQWGDGFLDESSAPQEGDDFTFRHVFGAANRHEVLVTAVYADGTTGSATAVIDVGGTPPTELNPLQKAFAPENLDMTFGVLGIAITAVGGLFGLTRHAARRTRLHRELEATKAAFAGAQGESAAVERALDGRRIAVQGLLHRGKLDASQTAFLDRQIDELRRDTRVAPLSKRFDYLPAAFALRLEGMLRDGRVSQTEHDQFLQELAKDKGLTAAQKSKVRKLIHGWRSHDALIVG